MSTTTQTLVVRPKISITDEDPVTKALAVYKMSKFSGCPDNYIGANIDRDLNRYITGLDENHPDVLTLPQEERLAKQKEILEERAFLEKELGVDLSHTNKDFWASLDMRIENGRVFNLTNPWDRVILGAIKAGKILPMSREEANDPLFKGVNFYIGAEYEDVEDKNKVREREREVVFRVRELLNNFDYAVEVCKYLNISGVTPKTPKSNLDDILSTWLERKNSNKDSFLDATKESRQFIDLSNKFREFKAKKLVEYQNGKFQAGRVALAKTEKESVKKLLSANPEMQAELARLLEELAEK